MSIIQSKIHIEGRFTDEEFGLRYERIRQRQKIGTQLVEQLAAAPNKPFTVKYHECVEPARQNRYRPFNGGPDDIVLVAEFELCPVTIMDLRMPAMPPVRSVARLEREATAAELVRLLIDHGRYEWRRRKLKFTRSRDAFLRRPLVAYLITEWKKKGRP